MVPYIIAIGILLLVCFVIAPRLYKRPTIIEKPNNNPKADNSRHPSNQFGIRDGEFVTCPHCGHKMRVGNGQIRPSFNCERCSQRIELCNKNEEEYQKKVQKERERIYNAMKGHS